LLDELTLLGKYGVDYLFRSPRMTNSLIREAYSDYNGSEDELETVLAHKSRVAKEVALQTLVVCSANKRYGRLPVDPNYMTALQRIISISSSMRDDVHDIWLIPNFLVGQPDLSQEDTFKMVSDDAWMCDFAKTQELTYDRKSGRMISPVHYANGSVMLSKFYEREIGRLKPEVIPTYNAGRSEVMKVQAD
jgi:hypothetical protein